MTKPRSRTYGYDMRLVLAAMFALALGLLPVGSARAAVSAAAAPAPMACHEMMMGDHMPMNSGDEQQPSHDMQACANHCLSQVNGQTTEAPAPQPWLANEIRAELGGEIDLGKVFYRDPPDPPPPRRQA